MAKNNPFSQGSNLAIANANAAGKNKGNAQFHTGGPVTQGPSRGLLNHDFFKIHIGHIPTGQKVTFDGWVTQFSDNYSVQWSEEQVYGRMDPLSTYQGTGRTIQMQFDIPNDSRLHANQNLQKIQKLIQFLYPVYDADPAQRTLKAAPLLTLKWANLASNAGLGDQKLVGYINGGLSYAPDVGDGGFLSSQVVKYGEKSAMGDKLGIRNLFPKTVSLGFTFTVLHTHLVGWTELPPVQPAQDVETEADDGDGSEAPEPKPPTKSFFFGGSKEIQSGYPYLNLQPPIPPEILESRLQAQLEADGLAEPVRDDDAADAQTLSQLDDEVAGMEFEEAQRERERRAEQAVIDAENTAAAQNSLNGLLHQGPSSAGESQEDFLKRLGITP